MKKGKYLDLHIHLDGAITVEIARKLALLQNIKLPTDDDEELFELLAAPKNCDNLVDFLKRFDLPLMLLQTREAISEAAYLVLEDEKKHGAIYVELRFAPQLHTKGGLSQKDAIEAVLEGTRKAEIRSNVILIAMRLNGNDIENMETVEVAKDFIVEDGGVTAIDLAGAEALFPLEHYREMFAKAKEYNIPFTIHAGEADGAQSVKAAIEFGARRVGHGVRALEDEKVMDMLRDNNVAAEMCPNSNRLTCAVKDMTKYPIREFMSHNIPVTVNTDDPSVVNTTIDKEFEYLRDIIGLTENEEETILRNSVGSVFASDETKAWLRKELELN